MKFRTIFITRKKIVAVLAIISVIAAVIYMLNNQTTEVFFVCEEDILCEGLPSQNEVDFFGGVKELFLAENIMSEMLPAAQEAVTKANTEPTLVPKEPDPTLTPIESTPMPLPSKEQISAASGIKISNATSYAVNADELCKGELGFNVELNSAPQVLIVHTHTTESYDGDAMSSNSDRNTDENKNVIAVGQVIHDTLAAYGIACVHDKTVHDYPTYQSAYTRTLGTIEKNLKENPSIKVVLDIHRDAFVYSDGSKLRVSANINGEQTAQVMLVVGTDAMGLYNPNWRENLRLAVKIQNAANIMYPELMRAIDLRTERFNMHMTTGSLLLEVGSNGNTLDEAKAGAKAAANAIAAVLLAK